MSLLDDVKVSLRVSTQAFDPEITMLIDAARRDMERIGIRHELIDNDLTMDPMAKQAVILYCKGHFGYDNGEAYRFLDSYRETVVSLMNSDANEVLNEME